MNIIYPAHQAKAKFSEVLRHVREGKTVTISYRGEPVAELRPTQAKQETRGGRVDDEPLPEEPVSGHTIEERMEELRSRGILVPAKNPKQPLKPTAHVPGALERFLKERG